MITSNKDNITLDNEILLLGNIGKFMKIKKDSKLYYLNPIKYDVSTLMMLLDKNKLKKLEEQFKQVDDGLEKLNFIKIMMSLLESDDNDKINLVYGIYKLFLEIDFNGDGTMQWEEFTQFIIDTVMGENDKNEGENDDDEAYISGKEVSEKALVKYKRYTISNKIQDRGLHETDVIECQYASKIDTLFCLEYKSKKLKLYNPKNGRSEKYFDLDNYFNSEVQATKNNNNFSNNVNFKNKKVNSNINKKINNKKSLTFSILSITVTYFNIVAICTTNKKILFFEFGNDGKEEKKIELDTPILQKKTWFLQEHNIWMSTGIKRDDDPYYNLYELDVEFEYKQNKWNVLTNVGTKINDRIHNDPFKKFYISYHEGEILDVIEIKKPNLYILTACMDKKIRLINIFEKEIVKHWTTKISSGVRSLDYNANVGAGLILSVGFEYYINIWSPIVALDEAHYGTLEGHYSPVITCRFICNSPICISCDEEGNVRVWDSRSKTTLQLIPQEKKNFKVNKLICLNKLNKIILYGNKLLFLDPKYIEIEDKPKNQKAEDNYPIKVVFNKYFLTFYVATMKDVKIYSSKNGELIKSLKSLRANISDQEVKIKQFLLDESDRKFYLGFNNGAIQQFNAGNGSLIKRIGENEEEKDGISTTTYDHTQDIVDLYIYSDKAQENIMLISCALDSLINVYNETDPEESNKLRTIKGGHKIDKNNSILAFSFSKHLNLFVTGSGNGLITVWDFELSKIDDVCYLNESKNLEITSLEFLGIYAVFAAAYNDGGIYFWQVKPSKDRGKCILKGRNNISLLGKTDTYSVKSMVFIDYKMDPIPKRNNVIKKIVDSNLYFNYEKKKETANLENNNNNNNNNTSINDLSNKFIINVPSDEMDDPDLDPSKYGDTNNEIYLILGDEKGHLKILDLKGFFKKYNIDPAPEGHIKSNYNILKKDDINVESLLAYNLQRLVNKPCNFTDINTYMTVNDLKAHNDEITGICLIEDPFSYVTCSKDKKIKIWSFNYILLGEINTMSNINSNPINQQSEWKFKVDWEKLKKQEITEVINIYEELEYSPISIDEAKLDKEDMPLEDKEEFIEKVKKLPILDIKKKDRRRFKPIEEKKKRLYEINDDKDNMANIDDQNHQEIIDNINKTIMPQTFNTGLCEMVRNLFDTNKVIKEEDKDLGFYRNKEFLDKKTKQGINKIQTLNSNVYIEPNKNNLFAEKYIKNNKLINRNNADIVNNNLPIINNKIKYNNSNNKYLNVKFKEGETERILSHEYYKSSYNNCVSVNKSNISNNTLKNNYNLMWKFVQNYSKNIIDRNSKK